MWTVETENWELERRNVTGRDNHLGDNWRQIRWRMSDKVVSGRNKQVRSIHYMKGMLRKEWAGQEISIMAALLNHLWRLKWRRVLTSQVPEPMGLRAPPPSSIPPIQWPIWHFFGYLKGIFRFICPCATHGHPTTKKFGSFPGLPSSKNCITIHSIS